MTAVSPLPAEQPAVSVSARVKHMHGGCVYVFIRTHTFSLLVKMRILMHLRTWAVPTHRAHESPVPTGARLLLVFSLPRPPLLQA